MQWVVESFVEDKIDYILADTVVAQNIAVGESPAGWDIVVGWDIGSLGEFGEIPKLSHK